MNYLQKTEPGHTYQLRNDHGGYDTFLVVSPASHSPLFNSSFISDIENSDSKTLVVNTETGQLSVHHYPKKKHQVVMTRGQVELGLSEDFGKALNTLSTPELQGCNIHCSKLGKYFYFSGDAEAVKELASVYSRLGFL